MNATKTETSTYRALCACIDLHIPVQIDTPMHPCKCLPFAPRSLSSQGDANAQARARALVDVHALAHALYFLRELLDTFCLAGTRFGIIVILTFWAVC